MNFNSKLDKLSNKGEDANTVAPFEIQNIGLDWLIKIFYILNERSID